jgi:Cdc6-like AAA superfamily ATPase
VICTAGSIVFQAFSKKHLLGFFRDSRVAEPSVSANQGDDRDSESDGEGSEDEFLTPSREPFLQWLSTDTGIFHISGKPGSGKSTLMEFLCDHDRTKKELQNGQVRHLFMNNSL